MKAFEISGRMVYVSDLSKVYESGYLISIPSVKWSYNVGSWAHSPNYWKEKLEPVLLPQNYDGEIDILANGLADLADKVR